jgi:hypothetical protein
MDAPVSGELNRLVRPVDGLQRLWPFIAGSVSRWSGIQRAWRSFRRRSVRPEHRILKPVFPASRWNIYFVYSPDAGLSQCQLYTLKALRATGTPLLVIVATRDAQTIPAMLTDFADALVWKSLSGYDFSAYRIGLEQMSERSPGADLLVMNDSVFGPFGDIERLVVSAPWRLTGFTSSAQIENHIQSYAFVLKAFDGEVLSQLGEVMPASHAFDFAGDVILCQEIPLARVAARHMSVGSFWHSVAARSDFDPMLHKPFELVDAGMPFLKKSLLGKMHFFQDCDVVRAKLEELGHPV